MTSRSDPGPQADAAQAIERVLRAEQQAEAELAQVRQLAQSRLDAAREEALAIVNRAASRIARWQRGHAAALERRLAVLRDEAAASASASRPPEAATIDAAVERVAAGLTGAAGAAGPDPIDVEK